MDRIEDRDDEIVELGVASVETKGGTIGVLDTRHQLDLNSGIADD